MFDPLSLAVVWVVTKSSVLVSSSLLNRRSPVQNGSTLLLWTETTRLVQFTRDGWAEWTHVPREAIIWREKSVVSIRRRKGNHTLWVQPLPLMPATGYPSRRIKNFTRTEFRSRKLLVQSTNYYTSVNIRIIEVSWGWHLASNKLCGPGFDPQLGQLRSLTATHKRVPLYCGWVGGTTQVEADGLGGFLREAVPGHLFCYLLLYLILYVSSQELNFVNKPTVFKWFQYKFEFKFTKHN